MSAKVVKIGSAKSRQDDLRCTLLPGSFFTNQAIPPIYNSFYEYWKKTWSEFFEKAGSPPDSLNIENFFRHAFLIVLHREQEIAGSLSSSVFHLGAQATYDHPHVRPFRDYLPDWKNDPAPGIAVTGEYLSVHPDYKKDILGVSLAEVMVGLLMEIFVAIDARYALATTVRKAKVDVIAKDYGYREIGSYLKCGVDCVVLYNTQETRVEHPNPKVRELVSRLWATREDITGLTLNTPARRKIG